MQSIPTELYTLYDWNSSAINWIFLVVNKLTRCQYIFSAAISVAMLHTFMDYIIKQK